MGAPSTPGYQPFASSRREARPAHVPRVRARLAATSGVLEQLRLAAAFTATVCSYLFAVLPRVRRELAHWQSRALLIPDPVLRRLALQALTKRGNMEGAALFAVLAPRHRRVPTVRALIAFQAAYNYLDGLAEQPNPEPVANGYQLHQALLVALDRGAPQPDYYAGYPRRADGSYLAAMVEACQTALAALPSHRVVADDAWAAAARIVAFQSLNLTEDQGGHELLQRWATDQTPAGLQLRWWQTAASCGSSLAVHALIAMAATPGLDAGDVVEINEAYHPWIGALHSLLDSLVDTEEDQRDGQLSLLGYHASSGEAASAMKALTHRAASAAGALPQSRRHVVILMAMISYYLSAAEARTSYARPVAAAVKSAAGPLLSPAMLLFKLKRASLSLAHTPFR
jgi:tetraprenyl-beta-curcumene synthase